MEISRFGIARLLVKRDGEHKETIGKVRSGELSSNPISAS